MVAMENQQIDVVVLQPAEAEIKVRKQPKIFWVGLDLVAFLFWLYAIIKVFVFDIDVYFVSLASSKFVWLLNYKLLILLSAQRRERRIVRSKLGDPTIICCHVIRPNQLRSV